MLYIDNESGYHSNYYFNTNVNPNLNTDANFNINHDDKNVNIQDVILNWTRKVNTPNYIKLTIDIDPFSFM